MTTRVRKSRNYVGTDRTTYNWDGAPRALVQAAIAKCKAQDPPVSLKWQIERLVREWVNDHAGIL